MGKIKTPYLLLFPGFAFLFTFFILPIVNLAQTSTQTPVGGGDTGQYEQTFAFSNYINAFVENREQFTRSFVYATIATVLALAISYPLAYAIAFKSGRWKKTYFWFWLLRPFLPLSFFVPLPGSKFLAKKALWFLDFEHLGLSAIALR